MMTKCGATWDNAKKWIKEGNLGGKGPPTHAAAIIGDTVGDPFKDTTGPSMNILIELMAIVSLIIAPFYGYNGNIDILDSSALPINHNPFHYFRCKL